MFPFILIITKAINANANVNAIFPDTLAPPGKNGTKPSKLFIKIKKKTESKKGTNFFYFFPILCFITSSTKYCIIGSKAD